MNKPLELHFRPQNKVDPNLLSELCLEIGISALGTNCNDLCPKLVSKFGKLTIYRRLFIEEDNKEKIKQILSKERFRNVLISVYCNTPELTKWSLTDNRIDIIEVDIANFGRFIDRKAAKLAKENEKIIEINLRPLIYQGNKIGFLRNLQKGIHWINKKKCQFIITSGATDLFELRNPRDLCGLVPLFQMSYEHALKSMSKDIITIIERNIDRITNQEELGIWKIRGEK